MTDITKGGNETMSILKLEGDPELLAQFDKALLEEFKNLGISEKVTVETQTVQAEVMPGEMGFGEEIRQILIGVSDVLQASKEATMIVAQGVANRLSQNIMTFDVLPDDNGITIRVKARTSENIDINESIKQIASILESQQGMS